MAKKARKKPAAKRGKKSKPAKKKQAAKRVTKRKVRRKAKPKSIGERLSSGYHTVIDTVKGTDRLRNKLEPPGTSESE